MTGPFLPLPRQIDARRRDLERVDQITDGLYTVTCLVDVTDPGEYTSTINFPILFTERPLFTFGGEAQSTTPILVGHAPTISVIVRAWSYRTRFDTGSRFFSGCSLLVVTTGTDGQLITAHCRFEGQGLRDTTATA